MAKKEDIDNTCDKLTTMQISYEERLYNLTRTYTVQDIEGLLEKKVDAAGLFLIPVFAGMITCGLVLYGFSLTDRAAFLKFATENMKLDSKLAEVLYDNVREGLIKQWCSHTGIRLFACNPVMGTAIKEVAFKVINMDILGISAPAIAKLYIETVKTLPEYFETEQHGYEGDHNVLRDKVREVLEGLE